MTKHYETKKSKTVTAGVCCFCNSTEGVTIKRENVFICAECGHGSVSVIMEQVK